MCTLYCDSSVRSYLYVFKYVPFQSNFKDYWRSETDVNIPTCLNLMQIYPLNNFFFRQFELRKKLFVDVSCIIKWNKSFLFKQFYKKTSKHILINCILFYIYSKFCIFFRFCWNQPKNILQYILYQKRTYPQHEELCTAMSHAGF